MIGSHSISIQLLENLVGHMMPHLQQAQNRRLPSDVLLTPKVKFRFKCGECVEIAFGELIVLFSESPNRLAIPMKTAVWTFTLPERPVKLGIVGLNSRRWMENGHVGSFDELSRAR
ncbi:hypothetical protein H5410_061114 [Solanum commersonii]|uniref:Uncharacterized protein n=1 Tax=Solanum commersonii TaxID=4109 RepID=A0A9J5W7Z7_SOLCO|nr:hypothetical protein H5410_061114 [Solanum commersonii]